MSNFKAPPFLKIGDTIAIVSMASAVQEKHIQKAQEYLTKEGFNVVLGEAVLSRFHNFAGDDSARSIDLQKALDDANVKAIISSRGGYGMTRILDDLDFTEFLKNPKWIVGFSDITALHLKVQSIGYQSIHGPMPSTFGFDASSTKRLLNLLRGDGIKLTIKSRKENRIGITQAPIIGGNLCLLAHCIGSLSDIDYDGKILLIEDIGEYMYAIDRMLVQLKRAGKFSKLKGIIVGDFSDVKEQETPFGKSIEEIVLERVGELDIPIAFGFPIGHDDVNIPVKLGDEIIFEVTENTSSIKNHVIS